jgi:hypothetical protein
MSARTTEECSGCGLEQTSITNGVCKECREEEARKRYEQSFEQVFEVINPLVTAWVSAELLGDGRQAELELTKLLVGLDVAARGLDNPDVPGDFVRDLQATFGSLGHKIGVMTTRLGYDC